LGDDRVHLKLGANFTAEFAENAENPLLNFSARFPGTARQGRCARSAVELFSTPAPELSCIQMTFIT